ncbi:hypothetical protein C8F01DRAFT_771157 [Mycena amicta]|nr:hypothetical protein C8F01DRAFT_771157 [Mycena amicta]
MASSTVADSAPRFSGQLKSLTKKTLVEQVFPALKLSSKDKSGKALTVDTLRDDLKKHLAENQATLQHDVRFAGLYPIAGTAKGSRKTPKNSAHKDAEVAAESAQPTLPLTGANLTLQQRNVLLDPPGKTMPLTLGKGEGKGKPSPEDGGSGSDASSVIDALPSPLTESELEGHAASDGEAGENDGADKSKKKSEEVTILLDLHQYKNQAAPPSQFMLKAPVHRTQAMDGSSFYNASLADIVPKLVNQASPLKGDRMAHIYRPALGVANNGTMDVGEVADFMRGGKPKYFAAADLVPLRTTVDDLFGLDMWYKPSVEENAPVPSSLGVSALTPAIPHLPQGGSGTSRSSVKGHPIQTLLDKANQNLFLLLIIGMTTPARTHTGSNVHAVQQMAMGKEVAAHIAKYRPFSRSDDLEATSGFVVWADWNPTNTVQAILDEHMPAWAKLRETSFNLLDAIEAGGFGRTVGKVARSTYLQGCKLKGPLGDWIRDGAVDDGQAWAKLGPTKFIALVGNAYREQHPHLQKNANKTQQQTRAEIDEQNLLQLALGTDVANVAGPSKPNRKRATSGGSGSAAKKSKKSRDEVEASSGEDSDTAAEREKLLQKIAALDKKGKGKGKGKQRARSITSDTLDDEQ